jgi:hypothetical protein
MPDKGKEKGNGKETERTSRRQEDRVSSNRRFLQRNIHGENAFRDPYSSRHGSVQFTPFSSRQYYGFDDGNYSQQYTPSTSNPLVGEEPPYSHGTPNMLNMPRYSQDDHTPSTSPVRGHDNGWPENYSNSPLLGPSHQHRPVTSYEELYSTRPATLSPAG